DVYKRQSWEREFYLDEALRCGISYDTQVLAHCDGVKFRDYHLQHHLPLLAQASQWLGRFPAFYGFNYNDEMFFGGWAQGWTKDDDAWLQKVQEEKFKDQPRVKTLEYALRVMYDSFNRTVRDCAPHLRLTTTPMWQFPAAEGSYPPVIYQGMDETYSHFLSEGYHYPWYPAHSVMFLRLPGMPVMGVFDNSYGYQDGDGYLQDMMQVLGRGAQGVGLQHFAAFDDPRGAKAYMLGNAIAKRYGHIFAACEPYDEAAVLYSYTQDIAEKRNSIGTPQFERVFELQGAALMAGIPMQIVLEESVAAGYLLKDGKPRFPLFFVVGLSQPLPTAVAKGIAAYEAAGGRVFCDAATAIGLGTKLDIDTHGLRSLYHEGYAADTIYPLFAPVLEKLAAQLRKAVGAWRRFPVEADNPWISRNLFDGGAIRYILLATDEGAPLPFAPGIVWSLNHLYRYSVLPQVADISFPWGGGVVYDVFAGAIAKPEIAGNTARLRVDMRFFPGCLLALAPSALAAPQLKAGVAGARAVYEVQVMAETGREMAACVPLRLRLRTDGFTAWEIYRGTDSIGKYRGETPLPANAALWSLEATELLSGKTSAVELQSPTALSELSLSRPAAEISDSGRLDRVLAQVPPADLGWLLAESFARAERLVLVRVPAFASDGLGSCLL
ncbi:MAG: hypothetical protein N3A66_06045, partial [Planctomycetota bacterium]|nr:hypothetical protein [Planctomycetota bacterium]